MLLFIDAIYVRVFEDHMDLIRAVIIGASGTPYHDGLFFFDFYLPSDYPQVPPVTMLLLSSICIRKLMVSDTNIQFGIGLFVCCLL